MPAKKTKRARPATAANSLKATGRSQPNARFQTKVLDWFDSHGRSFPWRETRDPYRTMVA
jgi:hypothetical protein